MVAVLPDSDPVIVSPNTKSSVMLSTPVSNLSISITSKNLLPLALDALNVSMYPVALLELPVIFSSLIQS